MLKWQRERDTEKCETVHVMYDGSSKIATIRNVRKGVRQFEVQIRTNSPWHRKSLAVAKGDCEFVYLNTKRRN